MHNSGTRLASKCNYQVSPVGSERCCIYIDELNLQVFISILPTFRPHVELFDCEGFGIYHIALKGSEHTKKKCKF